MCPAERQTEEDWEHLENLAKQKLRLLSNRQYRAMKDGRGHINMQPVPPLQASNGQDSQKLRKILRFCPYSKYFGDTEEVLRMKLPKKRQVMVEVSNMVIAWNKEREANLSEVEEQSKEDSSMQESSHNRSHFSSVNNSSMHSQNSQINRSINGSIDDAD